MSLKNLRKLLLILTALPIIACSQNQGSGSSSSSSSDSIAYLKGGEGDWVLKIDDFTINQTNFNKDLEAALVLQGATADQIALYANDAATKQMYADQLINTVLLFKKAEEEKFFETQEAKDFINLSIRNVKFQYYLTKLIADAAKNIPDPNPEQAQAFFDQAKQQLTQMYGITEYNTETTDRLPIPLCLHTRHIQRRNVVLLAQFRGQPHIQIFNDRRSARLFDIGKFNARAVVYVYAESAGRRKSGHRLSGRVLYMRADRPWRMGTCRHRLFAAHCRSLRHGQR